MISMMKALTIAGAALLGAQAFAAVHSHPVSLRRQVLGCMSRRMAGDRTLSYNDATKVCRAQVKTQNAALAVNAPQQPAPTDAR